MNDDWYTDKGGITRRRRGTWEGFWGIFMVANLFAIAVFIGVLIWAFFDVEHRIGYAMVAQIPPIAMMLIRRVFRDGFNSVDSSSALLSEGDRAAGEGGSSAPRIGGVPCR